MKLKMGWTLAAALLVVGVSLPTYAETVDEIIQLAKKGLGEEVLLASVERSEAGFALTADQIVQLKEAAVSEKVIAAMLRKKARVSQPVASHSEPDLKTVSREEAKQGTLNLENVDNKSWTYRLDVEGRVLWIFSSDSGEKRVLAPHEGVSLSVPTGAYEVRYAGEGTGTAFTVRSDEKSLIMISRTETTDFEGLYVSVFEKGERRGGGRLTVLRETRKGSQNRSSRQDSYTKSDEPRYEAPRVTERIIEREPVIEQPSTTIIYREPAPVYYPAYPYCYPSYRHSYYAPYCHPYNSLFFHYGRFGRRSGFSVGLGFGF